MPGSKLHRLAQERLRRLNAENRARQPDSEVPAKTESRAVKTPSIVQNVLESKSKTDPAKVISSREELKRRSIKLGGAVLSREELAALKRAAVVREREKRRQQRLLEEALEQERLKEAQQEAIRREKVRQCKSNNESQEPTENPSKYKSRKPSATTNLDAAKIQFYKEEAKAREAKRERLRKKANALKTQNAKEAHGEMLSYKEKAIALEKERLRRLEKERRLRKPQTERFSSREELERAFEDKTASMGGVIGINEAEKFIESNSRYSVAPSLRKQGVKVVSWVTLSEHLLSPREGHRRESSTRTETNDHISNDHENLPPPPNLSKRRSQQEIRNVLALCETSFCELARHSGFPNRVRPSDLNALHSTAEFDTILTFPSLSNEKDEPISWNTYKTWIVGQLTSGRPETAAAVQAVLVKRVIRTDSAITAAVEKPRLVAVKSPEAVTVPVLDDNDSESSASEEDSVETPATILNAVFEPSSSSAKEVRHDGELKVLDKHIDRLSARLAKISSGDSKGDAIADIEETSASASSSASSSPASSPNQSARSAFKFEKQLPIDRLENNFGKEKTEQQKEFDQDDVDSDENGENDGVKGTAQGGHMKCQDKVVFSGRCWMLCERKREDWLHAEVEWERSREICAEVEITQVNNPFRLYLRVHLLRSGLECMRRIGIDELAALTAQHARHAEQERVSLSQSGHHVLLKGQRCRSLGPDEWTHAELEAAIRAEESMRSWVREGRMPKKNDLVRWVLLHCTIRISGDELDPEDGHVDLVLPGDEALLKESPGWLSPLSSVVSPNVSLGTPKLKSSTPRIDNSLDRLNHVSVPSQSSLIAKARDILNTKKPDVGDVQSWLSEPTARKLARVHLQALMSPQLTTSEMRSLFPKHETALNVMAAWIDEENLHAEWAKRVKGLLVADLFDLFRTHEGIGENPGAVSADTFVGLLQDTLLLSTPTWQLTVLYTQYPRYRDFLKYMFRQSN